MTSTANGVASALPELAPADALPPTPPTIAPVAKRARTAYGTILSRSLPKYTGPHEVGVCDVELPVERQTFGSFKHKTMPNAQAGLTLDTVMFSLFYPAEPTPGSGSGRVVWFPNLRQTIDGFLKMARRTPNFWYKTLAYPVAAAAIWGTTFPAHANAPLKKAPDAKWPLVVFSHGVGCSRLMYSTFCGQLASRGYVVAAVEHRDGTGPSSTITTADGATRTLDWLQWSDLEWPDLEAQPPDDTILRHEQLNFRLAEVDAVLEALRSITAGRPVTLTRALTAPDFDWTAWRAVDCARPIMTGHSLGGSLGLAALADGRFDFSHVVVFDPAMQRLDPWIERLNLGIDPPLLVINSEEFAVSPDFGRLMGTVRTASDAAVYSIAGSTHPAFSDVFVILPQRITRMTGLKLDPTSMLDKTIDAVGRFLGRGGEKKAQGKQVRVVDGARLVDDGEPEGKLKKPIGTPGEMLEHVRTIPKADLD